MKRAGTILAAAGAAALASAAAAIPAQPAGNSADAAIGPPQLKDFSLTPRERIVTQPAPEPEAPAPQPARTPPPRAERPAAATPPPERPAERRAEAAAPAETSVPVRESPDREPAAPAAVAEAEFAQPEEQAPPAPAAAPTPAAPAAETEEGGGIWMFALPAAALAFLGFALVRRRRAGAAAPGPIAAPAAAPPPRPQPLPRPWLELDVKAQRTQLDDEEATVHFELTIRNSGAAPARNVRVGARMFNAGVELDKEIGSFFRTGSEERKTFAIPQIPPGESGVINGSVTLKRAEVRAIQVEGRALFVPAVAVNAFYDWGEGQAGQTARSYVVGRELKERADKMGPFRLDLGPRVWRTVGQRPHRMAKRT